MENKIAANCPVSGVKVNENVVRIIALLVAVNAAIAGYYHAYTWSFLLAIDFSIRAFSNGAYSPLRILAVSISNAVKLENKPVDAAPKKFAASLGCLFSLSMGVLQLFGLDTAANIVIALLLVCALLEGLLSVCVGCMVYSWLQRLSIIKSI